MAMPANNAITLGWGDLAVVGSQDNAWFKVPAVVDVSGMEFIFALGTTKAAASASTFSVQVEDGGSTGTASGVMFSRLTNSPSTGTAWTLGTVRAATGTTATDLDADDVVSISTISGGTAASGFAAAVAYIYGKPAVIN